MHRSILDRVDIAERPAEVENRQRLGDWEGDTVHGQSAYLGTLTEADIEHRIERLNLTPRKILGGLTPYEVFTRKRVALIG